MKQNFVIIFFVVAFCACTGIRTKKELSQNTTNESKQISVSSADDIVSESLERLGLQLDNPEYPDSCKKYGITPTAPVIKDTVVGDFRVTFLQRDNGTVVHGSSDAVFDNDVIFNVRYNDENILTKAVNRDSFSQFMHNDDIRKYNLQYFGLDNHDANSVTLNAMLCVPDTDIAYFYNIVIDINGKCDISDVTSIYGVMESETINIYYNNIQNTEFLGNNITPDTYEKHLTLSAPNIVNSVNSHIRKLKSRMRKFDNEKSGADIMIVSYENYDTLYLSRNPLGRIMHQSRIIYDDNNCIDRDTVFSQLIYEIIRCRDSEFVPDTID